MAEPLGPPPQREAPPARTRCGPLYLLTDLLERSAAYADEHGVSRNDVINAALAEYLAARGR
jgi:hypothetical protein